MHKLVKYARHFFWAILLCTGDGAFAWNNHTLLTWQALAVMPELKSRQVKVETLEDFLAAEGKALEQALVVQETWSREHIAHYPSRPDGLQWATGSAKDARARFMGALRVNPDTPLPLFLQLPPGSIARADALSHTAVTIFPKVSSVRDSPFRKLAPGELVSVTEVLATASNEPDYGLDIGLWEDNGTAHGQRYGFGKQPFGNPALEFSSQAPFHMGFYHESPITYALAGFLRNTYPEYRIHLYRTLASHALKTGHDYWGWRFAGWAMHYVGDLTQPYHARVLPGYSLPHMLWINTIATLGFGRAKNEAVTLVSNRHLAIEHYQYFRTNEATATTRNNDALLQSLRDNRGDAAHRRYADSSARDVVAREAVSMSDQLDTAIVAGFPPKFTSDPSYELGAENDEPDLWKMSKQSPPAAQAELENATTEMMRHYGTHLRAFVRSLLN